ncbi:MAG TPA: glucose 1-dehydrogenase [Baekduia sp.]|jgi:NAD(P)-dependent dehydrogenase (short-subunit alcohol dehydrogenase family)|nr:glucose 1-dehydrogenase [Baekduia sp.]
MNQLFGLHGRTVIVTGASSGLGERFARVLAAEGAHVVAAARRGDRLQALADEVPGVTACRCDVSIDADLERLVAFTVERHGRVDVLINNAGVGTPHAAESEPPEHFRHVVDVNLNALFVASQIAGRVMLEQGSGSIVNIASMFGLVGSAPIRQASYCASKGAVVNLTRELGAQWMRRGVRVNAIAPGFFLSEMTTELWEDERSMGFLRRMTPAGRPGEPHELDGALLFLAGDASTYVTGQTIAVDGGWTAR